MKQFHLILFSITLPLFLFSQENVLEWNEPVSLKFDRLHDNVKLVPKGTKTYFFHQNHYTPILKKNLVSDIVTYDFEINSVSKKDVNFSYQEQALILVKVFNTKNNTFALSHFMANNTFSCFAAKFENEKLESTEVIYQHPFKKNFEPRMQTNQYKPDIEFEFALSKDSTKVLFANQTSLHTRKKKKRSNRNSYF